jgi:acyl-CoA thioester hydrolase
MQEQIERLKVAWVDTDAGGRIHFTAVFRWAEAVETALFRRLGLLEGWADYPRRHVEAEYRKVLVFEDEVELNMRVDQIGKTSISYGWTISRDGELAIAGRHIVVHVDEHGRPAPVPDHVRAALSA